ncbi:Retrovirus-related Pol polyprotein from transposon 17.6 [Acropora cervicornis]|uniref:Retrovirus-related Pol polyprotein from transposon 17.6 n=1 Tax=Acropora cervicornis TaxID=6130 RepID=A0AAD9PYX7_ACRCE|nr:Retrovirus-related Pol polyprotein from transposon 17.6 [Acropora cervicornis]
MKPSVEYFPFVVDHNGVHTSPRKVQAIQQVPVPGNAAELKSFLGLGNYYRRFIPDIATLVHPLNRLLLENAPRKWSIQCQETFRKLKDILKSAPLLAHYDPAKPKFHQYLFGRHFTLQTDHKPLAFLFGPKRGSPVLAASRLQRWSIQLAACQYNIEYRQSKNHANAHALSRMPRKIIEEVDEWTKEANEVNHIQVERTLITVSKIRKASVEIQSSRVRCILHG